MLNIYPQDSAEDGKKYFSTSDYYSKDSQELVGHWGGKGAALLDLFGEVDKTSFEKLCDNINPATGKQLTPVKRDDRRVFYDFTFSAPKSVSVMHALTGDQIILDAFRESVRETMNDLEADMQTRIRKGKADNDRTTGNLISAEYIHLTSRPVDGMPCPQMHAHMAVFNATYDVTESRWKAGQFGAIKGSGYYWQAVQQAKFADRLQHLGYAIRLTKDAFEIVGVPQTVLDKFSLRAGVIERLAKKLGITDPKAKAKLAATTREAKVDSIPYSKLVEKWDEMLTQDERNTLTQIERFPITPNYENETHAAFAAKHLFARASVVDERRLLALALRHGIGAVTPEGISNAVSEMKLLRREENGKVQVTTKDIVREERSLLRFASSTRASCAPLASKRTDINVIDPELDEQQRAAASMPLYSSDRMMILRGKAGTGKTRTVTEMVKQLERASKSVVLVAPSTSAVSVLRDDGFDGADTIARLLVDSKMQAVATNGFILLDEAGMVGTPTMNAVIKVAKDTGARLVLIGDEKQLPSVERGSPLHMLEKKAKLQVAELANIRRQKGTYMEAVSLLSKGYATEGLAMLDKMDAIKLLPISDKYVPLAKEFGDRIAYAVARKQPLDKEAIIVCPTHADGNEVTEAVRTELRARDLIGRSDTEITRLIPTQWTDAQGDDRSHYMGNEIVQFHRNSGPFKAGQRVEVSKLLPELGKVKAAHFSVYTPAVMKVASGEMLRATASGKTSDGKHKLSKGSVYYVDRVAGDRIFLTNGWEVDQKFGHLTHAYVNTAYSSQGKTVNHLFVAHPTSASAASGREAFYVAASRGRQTITVYTDDRSALERAANRDRKRTSAVDHVAKKKKSFAQKFRNRTRNVQIASLVAEKTRMYERQLRSREMSYAR